MTIEEGFGILLQGLGVMFMIGGPIALFILAICIGIRIIDGK